MALQEEVLRAEFAETERLTKEFIEIIFTLGDMLPHWRFQEICDDYTSQLEELLRNYISTFVGNSFEHPDESFDRISRVLRFWRTLLERAAQHDIEDREDEAIFSNPVVRASIQRLGGQVRRLFVGISKRVARTMIYESDDENDDE